MATLDWLQCSAVETPAENVNGGLVLKGTQIPAHNVFHNLKGGSTAEDVSKQLGVDRELITGVLHFVVSSLEKAP